MIGTPLWIFFLFGYWFFTPVNILIAALHKAQKGSFFPNLVFAIIFFLQLALNLFVIYVQIGNELNMVHFSEYFLKGFIMYVMPATILSCFYCILQCYYFFVWEKNPPDND